MAKQTKLQHHGFYPYIILIPNFTRFSAAHRLIFSDGHSMAFYLKSKALISS
jgi:hypothetical protein